MYTIKSIIRRIRYYMRIGVSYERYYDIDDNRDMAGMVGYYDARGKTIAFRSNKGYLITKF